MKIVLKRGTSGLFPVDEQGFDLLSKIAEGREVTAEIKRARHPKHHRLFFSILRFITEHTEIESIEAAKNALKVATGEVDPVIDAVTGKCFFILRSIAWEAKGQDEFAAFFDRAIDVIVTRWMPPGTEADAVRAEIIKMADGPMMAGAGDQRRD
jgi:hypothetical protein